MAFKTFSIAVIRFIRLGKPKFHNKQHKVYAGPLTTDATQ